MPDSGELPQQTYDDVVALLQTPLPSGLMADMIASQRVEPTAGTRLRMVALGHAVTISQGRTTDPECVLLAARAFEMYLTGSENRGAECLG